MEEGGEDSSNDNVWYSKKEGGSKLLKVHNVIYVNNDKKYNY